MLFLFGSTVSLIIQIVVLGLLFGALVLKKKAKFRQHGLVMFSAVVLHIISILAVMGPSFSGFFGAPGVIDYADVFMVLTLVHVTSGILAAILGVWIVSSWHFQKNLQPCFKKKKFMDITWVLWVLAILIGIFLYLRIIETI
jgi:uncharacterized membrane protein YozB (DUF420 family)